MMMLSLGGEVDNKSTNTKEEATTTEDQDIWLNIRSHHLLTTAGSSSSHGCKDVDVVSELPDCSSTSTTAHSMGTLTKNDGQSKDLSLVGSRIRPQDDPSLNYGDIDASSVSSSMTEQRAPQRMPLAPSSKQAPSKWDDAQKWIASPATNRSKLGQAQVLGGQAVGPRKMVSVGFLTRQSSVKCVVQVPDHKMVAYEEPDTKRMDATQAKKEDVTQKLASLEGDPCPVADSYGKSVHVIEKFVGQTAIDLSRHNSSLAVRTATTFLPPPSMARSVSMRDMGTEMTPIASQEPSRNGTPLRSTTPICSLTSSRPSTPTRASPTPPPTSPPSEHQSSNKQLSEKELQVKTRSEIVMLGTQLGKMSIAAWASKEEEDKDASTSLKNLAAEQPTESVIKRRAASWEDAEKAKYMARFKREEMKLQAWENHQRAKAEAEMKKIEVEIERMRGKAQDRLMKKIAAVRHKAEEKRAAGEAKRNRQVAKAEKQADYIRKTGRVPSSFSCCGWYS